ncbi:MAG: Nucleoside triphosphate pyrophosphohydrolase MazG [uncultured Acidimicrobiales bacterium]|uniref:Nucleoside triphosphate pyrophosphohydrolase MazG n=1 Tax=uncultured Acidimicrobiales bacterium TaxID=310071 RepID=A0A6J4HIW2_9ACTN|nr:MAG: Nucleoside triphosphate pyrophosphohydrolase MazG [uncultured Acidimicrobiales bacterium]
MTGRVVIVGLGPAGPDLLPPMVLAAIDRIPHRFLRTERHPAAAVMTSAGCASFDALYEQAASIDQVYAGIVDALAAAAAEHGEVLYAVPGSPAVAERTVELLRADPRVEVDVLPAMSFLDLAWIRLGVDPLAEGVRIVDGHRFATDAAGERGPMLVAQCDTRTVLSDIKLALDPAPTARPIVVQRLGLPDEAVFEVAWEDLDRAVVPDHLTAVYLPAVAVPVGAELVRFWELMRTLREACPWDREQTHASLTRYLVEETYEVIEAIEQLESEGYDHLEEELGDLLLQVYFHATIAAEAGAFTLADVARGIHDKMVDRHPHVFAADEPDGAEGLEQSWEARKRREKGREGAMEGIPGGLPALLHAAKAGKRAAAVGFDWPEIQPVYAKVTEELGELRDDPSADELGDLLFAVVNVARHLDLDPEAALRQATAKFKARFALVERAAAAQGLDLRSAPPAQVDVLWEHAKAELADGLVVNGGLPEARSRVL